MRGSEGAASSVAILHAHRAQNLGIPLGVWSLARRGMERRGEKEERRRGRRGEEEGRESERGVREGGNEGE